jgi:hypothetical protein
MFSTRTHKHVAITQGGIQVLESESDSDESENSGNQEDLFLAELQKIHELEMQSFDVEMEEDSDVD